MRGDRLAELRKDAGLTQRQFAQQMHVSLNTVSGWERGLADPDDETKLLLAQRFGVTADYLLGLSDRREPSREKGVSFVFSGARPRDAAGYRGALPLYLKKKNGVSQNGAASQTRGRRFSAFGEPRLRSRRRCGGRG